jgi:hypothetical protein
VTFLIFSYFSAYLTSCISSPPTKPSSRAADSLKRVGREMTKHVPSAISRVKSKGAPGLAFETWDPSNQFPLETPTLLFVILSEALRRSIANTELNGAESKDPGGAYLAYAARSFSTTEPSPGGPATVFPRRPTTKCKKRFTGDIKCLPQQILFSGLGGRRTPKMLILSMLFLAFDHQSPRTGPTAIVRYLSYRVV